MEFHFFVCSFCRVVQVAKRRNGISFLRFFVLYKSTKRRNEKTKKWNFISSFVRFVALYKSPKRRNGFYFFVSSFCLVVQCAKTNKHENEISKFHFFVCSFCRVVQVAKTKKWISFLRFFVLSRWSKHDKTTKRQSYREISKFDFSWLLVCFVVYSFCRLPQSTCFVAKTTERQRDKMRFCGHFVLSFVRFVALYKSPKRRNEISFWRLFVLSPSIRRQTNKRNGRIRLRLPYYCFSTHHMQYRSTWIDDKWRRTMSARRPSSQPGFGDHTLVDVCVPVLVTTLKTGKGASLWCLNEKRCLR